MLAMNSGFICTSKIVVGGHGYGRRSGLLQPAEGFWRDQFGDLFVTEQFLVDE